MPSLKFNQHELLTNDLTTVINERHNADKNYFII